MAMTDDLEAALDSIEHPADLGDKTWLLTVYVPAATTLAAAVREMRWHESIGESYRERLVKAEAALAEMRGRTCDACQFHWFNYGDLCKLHGGQCNHFGFTCGAWTTAKEQA